MRTRHIFYTFFLLLLPFTGKSQFAGFSKNADRYFTVEEYHKLAKEAAVELAREQDIAESVFIENYTAYQADIETISRPLIIKKFRWLEAGFATTPATGTPAFIKRKETYSREFKRGVRDALISNESFLKSIRNIDQADRILSYNSDITVHVNGLLTVIETIRVYNGDGGGQSNNNEIQRGITRSFPTQYTNSAGLIATVPFRLQKVLKNKEPEAYFTKKAENGIVLYIGNRDKMLQPGIYTYEITYETERQLIFHTDKDECYWNVNGNGWSFVCEQASCTIHFPAGASIIESSCYTGVQGATEHACSDDSSKTNTIHFKSVRVLQPYEGFTVAASIRKGILHEPSFFEKIAILLRDNIILVVLGLTAFLLFFFHFRTWQRVGKDPKKGVIIPRFEPPAGMSPADAGYLVKQKYGAHLFAASLVDYAIHHKLDIEVKKEGVLFKTPVYYFQRPENLSNVDDDKYYDWYGYDIDSLYGQKAERGNYNSAIASVYNKLGEQLKDRLLIKKGTKNKFRGMFSMNDNYTGRGAATLVLVTIASFVYLIFFHTAVLVIASILLLVICIIIQVFFTKIMRAYTSEGRATADKVEGFKMYLKTAEENRFNLMNPPAMTIQLFEKYLPFAIALQCENAWASKFEGVIKQAAEQGYQPAYYRGSIGSNFSSSSFTSGFSSGLAGTISSASTPPSSSSGGSSGGGSSGGGGGGGGGGGW